MTTNIIAFAVVLGVLIFFHELGHFLAARFFKVGVEKFSLGFGPRLFGKKVGITDYRISAIPLGGYVKMVGEEPGADIDPEDIPISFTHKSVYKRIVIVSAGPVFNLILAVIVFFIISITNGMYYLTPTVGKMTENGPAMNAGMKEGDIILSIDDGAGEKPVETWDDMAVIISESNGAELKFLVHRDDGNHWIVVRPELKTTKNLFGEDQKRYLIGVTSSGKTEKKELSFNEAFIESFVQTYKISELMVVSVAKLITGAVSHKTLGGPIMIAQMAGEQAKEGFLNLLNFIAVISINLGILNFLPIPVLDGGHLLFFIIEAGLGRPINTRIREIAQQTGMFFLLLLMILVTYNDITR